MTCASAPERERAPKSAAVGKRRAGSKRSRAANTPTSDPVTAYARAVVDGRVRTGRAVRLTCERHLRDLARQKTDAFPYVFDSGAAQHIIDFFPEFLTLEDGSAFVLTDWLQFCLGAIFGWKHWGGTRNGLRRFQTGYIETAKGSGKTPTLAGVGLYGLAFDDEPAAQIYSAGFDKGQASIILDDAIRMAKASPDLIDILDVGKYNIAHPQSGSFFRALSSEHRSKSGPRPSIALIDELHEHRDGTVVTKVEAGFKFRLQPLKIEITNSGADKTSVCWQHHEKSLKVLEGVLQDEQWFAYVCQLDPCDHCHAEGYRQPKDGCPDCDDWTNPDVWIKVNPSLGVILPVDYLAKQVNTAQTLPSEQALIKRLNFCIWTATHQVWISSDRWDACKVGEVRDANPHGYAAAGGLDPSEVHDSSSFVVAIRIDDPLSDEEPEEVAIEGMNEFGEQIRLVFKLNYHVELVPYFWLPEKTLLERVKNDRIPFDVWRRASKLFATPGPAIDHHAIYDFIMKDAWKRFRIQRLGMDPNRGRYLYERLRQEGRLGDRVVQIAQGPKLSEAYKFIEILIAHRRLRHDGHPVLAWNVANAEPQRNRTGAIWIEKPEPKKLIDGAVAMAMAVSQLMTLPKQRSIYETRGALVL